jgi:hypothetical protein
MAERHGFRAGAVDDRSSHTVEEVGTDLVHLVDEDDARHLVSAWRHTVSVWGSTPATPSSTQIAPSSTRKRTLNFDGEVDVSGRVDDVHPIGVVGALFRRVFLPLPEGRGAADVMVMPRSCSCSIQSIVAAPSCTSPMLWDLPV